jgi:hypothetical protein
MLEKCVDCPFARTGPGAHLRRTLQRGRWREILTGLLNEQHFMCHKTTPETGDGSNRVCAGAIEWQDRRGVSSQYVRICERLDYFKEKRETKRQ